MRIIISHFPLYLTYSLYSPILFLLFHSIVLFYNPFQVNRETTHSSHVHFCHCTPKPHWFLSVYIRPTHLTTPKEDKAHQLPLKPSYTYIGPHISLYINYYTIHFSSFLNHMQNWEKQTLKSKIRNAKTKPFKSLNQSSVSSLQRNLNVGFGLSSSICIYVCMKAMFEWPC